jgi:aldehyde dehydrogenase (NAD+)
MWKGQYDRLFVGGRWVSPSSNDAISVVSPTTEEIIAEVPSATREDVDAAVDAAVAALESGVWLDQTLEQRLEVMHRFRALYAKRAPEMAELITEEMGCPIELSHLIQTGTPLAILDAYLELALDYPFRTLRGRGPSRALVTKEPVGVVAAIVPWNVPQSTLMMKLAPALLTGCAVIVKPAPETPLNAYLVAELLDEAGVPDGVVSVVPADREVSEYLATHPGVDKVAFTGSTAVGRHLASVCGAGLKRMTLELGGKSAAIFLDDADLTQAVEKLRLLSLRNSGQVCSLKTRLLVTERRKQDLIDALSGLLDSMPVGDPRLPTTQIGPMVSKRQQGIVNGYIESGIASGARVVAQQEVPQELDRGYFVPPTIFSEVTSDMKIAQEEIFGPVLSILTYDDVDHAVAIANDSPYGLNGAVFTEDLEHGMRVARRMRTGTVELNGSPAGFFAPTGGFKWSGVGREAGLEGFDEYVEPRSLGLPAELAESLAQQVRPLAGLLAVPDLEAAPPGDGR